MSRRVLIPASLPSTLPAGGGHLAHAIRDFSGTTMGTSWRARGVTSDRLASAELERIIGEALATVVARMSPWEPDSDLGRYQRAPAGTWVPLSAETFTVLNRAREVAALTGGLYDPTIGRLTDALGFGPSDPATAALPGSNAAEDARQAVGYQAALLNPAHRAVYQPGGLQLDLCSIAKGYAVDLAGDRLAAVGVTSSFIEIGGEARGRGCKPDGQPWWCLIEPPVEADAQLPTTVVAACDLALATSGNSVRRRVLPDRELGHIVSADPVRPLHPTLESVTIIAATCMEADVFATALYLLGPEDGLAFASANDLSALFVERVPGGGHRERWSPRFATLIA